MDGDGLRSHASGVSQAGLRAHNERVLLSLIQREGPIAGTDLAKRTHLSAQTVSVILRRLETDNLLRRGDPQRGKVGKPSVPIELNPSGAFSFGLKIGRRSAELALMDFTGTLRAHLHLPYRYPMPGPIEAFALDGMTRLTANLSPAEQERVGGLGIAAPNEIWNLHSGFGAPKEALEAWQTTDLAENLRRLTGLPVWKINDATAACRAEHVYGCGRELTDYAYFYVGAFVGGGIVMEGKVMEGRTGNAAAFGPLPAKNGKKLIDTASLFLLEDALQAAGKDSGQLWQSPPDWSGIEPELETWCAAVGQELARACVTVYAVLDLEAVLIDGAFPPQVRDRVVTHAQTALTALDKRWLPNPTIIQGSSGVTARVLGAACGPIIAEYF